ncbi:ATP-binding protein [Litorimonas sp. RW-G-Af-16]|uniref:ATP-binding protein n=1 Tax=Litorimonas sp. RW-G-Af-16 TaxID=3241168 RepID=UPI00390CAEEB
MANRSLVSSLVRSATLWAVPALLISAIILTLLYRDTIYRSFDAPLESAVTSLIASAEVDESGAVRLTREPQDDDFQRALSGRYWLIGREVAGEPLDVLLASRSLYGSTLSLQDHATSDLQERAGDFIRTSAVGPDANEPLRVLARQVVLPNMEQPVIVLAGADRRPVSRSISRFAIIAILLLTMVTLGLVAAIWAQVRIGLKPLFALRDRVVDVREGHAAQVDGDYPPEIQPLAIELNSLISHNKNIVERARTHVGNLAHALKTPLAVLQNEARNQTKTPSDIVLRQTETMASQVDHHLRRARAAARGQAIGVMTPIDEVIDGLVRTLPRIYRDKNLQIKKTGQKGLTFRGARRDFEEMAGNLMDNAAKWTTETIAINISHMSDDTLMEITIEDDGPGLSEADYAEALKRGARLDEATPGSGLGLSIVDDLASAYKGHISLAKSELGGLKATLVLPRAKG